MRLFSLLFVLSLAACAAADRPFPLRDPMTVDTDMRPVTVACRSVPTPKDPHNISCAPDVYVSPLIWDGADNMVFRPLSEAVGVEHHGEAVNANSLDEVVDSAWFTNRIGVHPIPLEQFVMGACRPDQMLDPSAFADGSWLIDHGKTDGSSPGFRVTIPGKGKYLFKGEVKDEPERPSAASVIGAAAYEAVGFNTSCEQVIYFRPSLLKLAPGLTVKANFGGTEPFNQRRVDKILADSPHRDGLVRMQASAWLPGYLIGPFTYTGTRHDDPNDVIPHDDRRELRGGRLLAAWLDHFDAREQNSLDTWVTSAPGAPGAKPKPDASPGHVVHYYLDTSDCLGSLWAWEEITRRLGHSYVVDWGDIAADFFTLGIPLRPWDRLPDATGHEMFRYYGVENFDPEQWKNEYPNAAFSRMTERDGAWMARILAKFTPEMVQTLAEMAKLAEPANAAYLAHVLEGRLDKILQRYLTRLSPLASVHMEGTNRLCAEDLAEARGLQLPSAFRYQASFVGGPSVSVTSSAPAAICVELPAPHDVAAPRYVRVTISDAVVPGPLIAHLYDLGQAGYRLVGLERPEP